MLSAKKEPPVFRRGLQRHCDTKWVQITGTTRTTRRLSFSTKSAAASLPHRSSAATPKQTWILSAKTNPRCAVQCVPA